MSGVGLVFSILLGVVLLYSLWHARQRKQPVGPQEAMDDLDPREREVITQELQAGRTLNAIARLRRAVPGLSLETAKEVIELISETRKRNFNCDER